METQNMVLMVVAVGIAVLDAAIEHWAISLARMFRRRQAARGAGVAATQTPCATCPGG